MNARHFLLSASSVRAHINTCCCWSLSPDRMPIREEVRLPAKDGQMGGGGLVEDTLWML